MKIRIDINTDNEAFLADWRGEVKGLIDRALPKMHDDVEVVVLRDERGVVVGKMTRLEK